MDWLLPFIVAIGLFIPAWATLVYLLLGISSTIIGVREQNKVKTMNGLKTAFISVLVLTGLFLIWVWSGSSML